ncbi:MAG: response regulator transcription factor [Oscillospiraceae bacterium]|nr:response regulator transcription factor [Oscillospiraceae bacterium]
MLTIAICDDNLHFADTMRKRIYDLCVKYVPEKVDCRVLGVFTSGVELKEFMKDTPVSILFLDIDMPGMSGFELAKNICDDHQETIIIFVSSLDDFVYSSLEYSPFRFLRKSRLNEELQDCFIKVIDKCTSDNESAVFNTVKGDQVIRFKDIVFIENDANYYVVHTGDGTLYKCRGSLNDAENLLSNHDFFRIQQSYLVNFEQIKTVDGKDVLTKTGERLAISRRCINDFKTAYLKYSRRRF